MRDEIKEYDAVAKAAEKFVKSVAEGNSEYAKTLFTGDAVLFGILNGAVERGSIEQFYIMSIPWEPERNLRPVSTSWL